MKTLILGGTGMLGHQLWSTLRGRTDAYVTVRRRPLHDSLYDSLFEKDRTLVGVSAEDFDTVADAFAKVRPDAVVNCIGVVKQQGAANDPVACIGINALFPHRLAKLCGGAGARLIHLSTDCVFSGKRGNYAETDAPDAEDLYGRSKLLGETTAPRCLTIRTSIIGRELGSRQGLIEWFLSQAGKKISGYKKAIFSGLTTAELSRLIATLLEKHPGLEGLYHVAADPIDKFELLSLTKKALGVTIEIEPNETFKCDRSLSGEKFRRATAWSAPAWPRMIADLRHAPVNKE